MGEPKAYKRLWWLQKKPSWSEQKKKDDIG